LLNPTPEASQALDVSIHPKVVNVALHFPHERGVLQPDWLMPVLLAPVPYGAYGPCQAITPGFA
jgi:hypothetical protein